VKYPPSRAEWREIVMRFSGIKSRPRYEILEPDRLARFNLVLAEGEGANAAVRLLESVDHQFRTQTTIYRYRALRIARAAYPMYPLQGHY
jgi:hypothetical protein